MSLCVEERIRQNVRDTLKGVTVVAGYNNNLTVEIPRPLQYNEIADRKTLIVGGDVTLEQNQPFGQDSYVRQYHILTYIVLSDEDTTTDFDTLRGLVAADVFKAMMAAPHRGTLAVDTIPKGWRPFEEEDASGAGVIVDFEIHYRTLTDDPYTSPFEEN